MAQSEVTWCGGAGCIDQTGLDSAAAGAEDVTNTQEKQAAEDTQEDLAQAGSWAVEAEDETGAFEKEAGGQEDLAQADALPAVELEADNVSGSLEQQEAGEEPQEDPLQADALPAAEQEAEETIFSSETEKGTTEPPSTATNAEEKAKILQLLQETLLQEKELLSADQLMKLEEKIDTKYRKKLDKASGLLKLQLDEALVSLEKEEAAIVASLPSLPELEAVMVETTVYLIDALEKEAEEIIEAHQEELDRQLGLRLKDAEVLLTLQARDSLNQVSEALLKDQVERLDHLTHFREQMAARLTQMSKLVEATGATHTRASKQQLHNLYLLRLSDRIRMQEDLTAPLAALRQRTEPGSPLALLLDQLPSSGTTQYSLLQLTSDYERAKSEARRRSFLPANGREEWRDRLVASLFSAITVPLHGKVSGDDTEALIARAEFYLHRGQVSQALKALDRLEGPPREAMKEWCDRADKYQRVHTWQQSLYKGL